MHKNYSSCMFFFQIIPLVIFLIPKKGRHLFFRWKTILFIINIIIIIIIINF